MVPEITDEQMFRWLFSGHTLEELKANDSSGSQPKITIQDKCLAELSCWYQTLEGARDIIRSYMEQGEQNGTS